MTILDNVKQTYLTGRPSDKPKCPVCGYDCNKCDGGEVHRQAVKSVDPVVFIFLVKEKPLE